MFDCSDPLSMENSSGVCLAGIAAVRYRGGTGLSHTKPTSAVVASPVPALEVIAVMSLLLQLFMCSCLLCSPFLKKGGKDGGSSGPGEKQQHDFHDSRMSVPAIKYDKGSYLTG